MKARLAQLLLTIAVLGITGCHVEEIADGTGQKVLGEIQSRLRGHTTNDACIHLATDVAPRGDLPRAVLAVREPGDWKFHRPDYLIEDDWYELVLASDVVESGMVIIEVKVQDGHCISFRLHEVLS